MKTMQTNIKQPYLPPEIIIEEYFDDEMLLDASPIQGEGTGSNNMTGDGDPTDRGAKATIWGADFSTFDEDEDY